MEHLGEIISLAVACMWTVTALVSEIGTKRLGVLNMNFWRLLMATLFTAVLLVIVTDTPFPIYAGLETWLLMGASGFVGFFLGDYCLFKSYLHIGSRYGQLFMTLSPAAAALMAWVTLGQTLTWMNLIAMIVTGIGIVITILGRSDDGQSLSLSLPWKGVLFGIGAGTCQGIGLVLSKIGMNSYSNDIPMEMLSNLETILPFAANFIRCITGFLFFFLLILFRKKFGELVEVSSDKKGMIAMLVAVIFGPFVGVGLSLTAVQYTAAGIASTLMALTPIIIIIPSRIIFKTPITFKGVIGAIISCIGVALFFIG